MVSFYKRFCFFKIYENWFSYEFKISDIFSINAYLVIKDFKHNRAWGIKKISYTVENSLVQDSDVMFSGLSRNFRQDIRNAEKDGIECCFHQDIEWFVDFYNAFAINKKIPTTSKKRIAEMGENLKLSYALLNGQILSAHSYLVDKEVGIVMCMHSASLRFDNNFDAWKIGRSNKLLHFKDMINFKEQGFKVYDFGGYTENTNNKSLIGINRFKLSFGGKKVICVNYYSIGYVLLKWLQKLLCLLRIIKY